MNTTETNKKFAEFLGWEQFGNVGLYATTFNNDKGSLKWLTKDMKFHKDWNWLMLVVDKIEATAQLGNENDNHIVSTKGNRCSIINKYGELHNVEGQTKIEAVYGLCSMFIDWYNNNKG